MKTLAITAIALLVGIAGEAMAACSGTQVVNDGVSVATENVTITFKNLSSGQTTMVGGVTFTAPGPGTSPANAVGDHFRTNKPTGWGTGTGFGSPVTFTSTTANTNVANLTYSTTGAALAVGTYTQGSSGNALTALLTGNTVCVGSGPTWNAQEYHQLGGALIDWKRGSGTKDPTSQVGNWSITGTGTDTQVIYNYGSAATTYSNRVWSNGGNSYSFCNPSETVGTIKSGQGACP